MQSLGEEGVTDALGYSLITSASGRESCTLAAHRRLCFIVGRFYDVTGPRGDRGCSGSSVI